MAKVAKTQRGKIERRKLYEAKTTNTTKVVKNEHKWEAQLSMRVPVFVCSKAVFLLHFGIQQVVSKATVQ